MKQALWLILAWVGASSALAQESIFAEAIVKAPIAEVWKGWATPEGLRSWVAPHADIDARVGGLMRTNYNENGKLGDPSTIENRVIALEPQRLLSIQVAKAPEDFPFRARVSEMRTVISLSPAPGGQTQIRIEAMGFKPDAESQEMKAFFQRGNEFTLQQLQEHFAK